MTTMETATTAPFDLNNEIFKVIDRRADRNIDGITEDVLQDLPEKHREALTPSPSMVLYRIVRRRVRALLRHDPRQLSLPFLQTHYYTPAKDVWVALREMGIETARWILGRLDERRKKAEAECTAFEAWMRERFPEEFAEDDQRERDARIARAFGRKGV